MTDQQWHTAERITVIVRRRKLRRALASGAVVIAVAGTTIGLSVSGSDTKEHSIHVAIQPGSGIGERLPGAIQLVGKTTPLTKTDSKATAAVANADSALAVTLLQHANLLPDDDNGPNVSTSPFSLFVALAMLENGARGKEADGIAKALQASRLGITTQNVGLAQLIASLSQQAAAGGITLETANSLWQQQGYPIKAELLSTIATYFHAGVWQTDFLNHNAQALAAIDQWTSDKTHGKITKLFDSLDVRTVLVLANALYFHAAWQNPFDPVKTAPGEFTTAKGNLRRAHFMDGQAAATATSRYQAATLPYQGGQFEAVAVMPRSGSLSSFVSGLSAGELSDIAKAADATSGGQSEVWLPKFTTTASMNMKPMLAALGMSFGGDFTGIADDPTLVLDQVRQRVYLGVGEAGTTAAAVTGDAMIAQSTHMSGIAFDHPFLFLIRDKVSGAILFASEINDPS